MNKTNIESITMNQIDQNKKIEQLINLSVKGLTKMFDTSSRLFCYRVMRNNNELIKEGFSYRYTIISLIGFYKLEEQGFSVPIDIQTTLFSLIESIENIDNIGDLGLLIWLCALVSPKQLQIIYSKVDICSALKRYPDALQGRTMELSWFLTGLSYAVLSREVDSQNLKNVAKSTYNILRNNYGGKGIFGHQNKSSLVGIIRDRIGTFADQVYPIYALTKYFQAYDCKEALIIASDCAEIVCCYQGELGQWWWHYDSKNGKVVGRYPVYSVHQDGMAPMALFTISEETGQNFKPQIYKGLEWIAGNNEIGSNLIDTSRNVIWRSFYRKKYKMYYDEALSLLQFKKKENSYKDLKINFECRPYHLGWILYSFATKVEKVKL